MTDETDASATRMPGSPNTWRLLSNLRILWAVGDHAGCRRAQSCRGDSRQCIPDFGSLVPEDARTWAIELFECKCKGLSFDDARVTLSPESEEAWTTWDEAVRRIIGRPRRHGS
jgi:hypothetical protein